MAIPSVESVKAKLLEALQADSVEVIDTSGGCGASFEVFIVSSQFEGKTLLQRHRLVNDSLKEEMQHIHALSIKKAQTPQQAAAAATAQ